MKKIVLASLALALGWSGTAFAQTEVDALRYSRLGVSGTARIQGLGGAQSALGSDVSSLFVNPAGLGMFRRSEFTVTPAIQSSKIQASINGNSFSDNRSDFTLPQLGIVFANRKDDEEVGDWRGVSFGIGLTRLNNFNEQLRPYSVFSGETDPTIVEYFADQAYLKNRTQADLDDELNDGITTLEGLGYGAYLLNFDEEGNPLPEYREGRILQQEDIIRTGAQNQVDFGVGTSFRDKLYLGASLGIVTTNFTQQSIYREVEDSPNTPFTSLELYDEFTTRGTGINLKVGVIARPVDALRLGLSIQTPTAYTLTDEYQRTLYANFDDSGTERAAELPGQFTYRLTTPFRATGGAAVFLGKYGFLTADVEYVNYSSARFREDNDDLGSAGNYFDEVNNRINNLKSTWNYRFGAEGRFDIFRVRAGYAFSADPDTDTNFEAGAINQKFGSVSSYTLGAGVRLQQFFVDLAYVHAVGEVGYAPYVSNSFYTPFANASSEPVVDIEKVQNSAVLTVGYNF
ncbi:hypothetical protein CLV24_112121 [Pontibacter ummariensis]|uniref:Outer membrane protein transport protein (OMPP1/FadL/TodX) n=1 Tax=Pontibacter ummariensis TaxID=1610492 RepID=A0A239GXC3_9BACT|nr:hypothetical protein [Pontibacter ummariensis]PRY10994.1 hypothetical protein CLV24_112121 [Pontibacter ummariensis]SNS73418.1 hypothetical protein SAMN06296052_11257 [Pontibacter ummariensis]